MMSFSSVLLMDLIREGKGFDVQMANAVFFYRFWHRRRVLATVLLYIHYLLSTPAAS